MVLNCGFLRNSTVVISFLAVCCLGCVEKDTGAANESGLLLPKDASLVHQVTQDNSADEVDDRRLRAAAKDHADWLTYGLNYNEDRYSLLTQIGKNNIAELGLAWAFDLPSTRGIQATPLAVNGILYFTGPWSVVYAVDARMGRLLWKYDPEVSRQAAILLCCGAMNRGVALYDGAIFVGTLDGRLISLDADSGDVNWSVMTVPENGNYSITGAPRVANGKVFIGNGGAEYAGVRGYVTAYDAETGEQVWRFYTVPGNPSEPFEDPILGLAAKTWTGEWWKQGGGGTAWDTIVFDPEFNQVIIGVGNGSHWNRNIRSPGGGDNLFLSSIVALDADSGAYRWHYQTTPGDSWDYTATQPIILAELTIEGTRRKVAMQAPKNGFFYVLDRESGELISAEPYTYTNWAKRIDARGRPVEEPGIRYEDGKTHWLAPGSHGGHNWFPMTYSHDTGLVYIPGVKQSGPYAYNSKFPNTVNGVINGNEWAVSFAMQMFNYQVIDPNAPAPGEESGELIAYDPIQQRRVWSIDQPSYYNGGLLSTASGLLLQGDAEGFFRIRSAESGKLLWQFDVRSGVISSPITYLVDGEQYITIIAEWGGGRGQIFKLTDAVYPGTVYTFKLGGTAVGKERVGASVRPLTDLTTDASPSSIGNGYTHYLQNCFGCHGQVGQEGGTTPNLARSEPLTFENYDLIVRKGAFAQSGMPKQDHLSERDVEDIKAYVIFVAQTLRDSKLSSEELAARLASYQKVSIDAQAPTGAK